MSAPPTLPCAGCLPQVFIHHLFGPACACPLSFRTHLVWGFSVPLFSTPSVMGPKRSGKKWHHHQQPKRPRNEEDSGGDDSEGEQRPKKPRRAAVISLGNVKGHQAVVGTCDIRNDRQATAELVDLLNAVADDMYPAEAEENEAGSEGGEATAVGPSSTAVSSSTNEESGVGGDGSELEKSALSATAVAATATGAAAAPEKSVEEMIRAEAAELRSGKVKTHRFKSVNTTVKGVVMICVMDPKIDILRLVDALYAEIRTTKMRRSRFLERVTPLQVTAYSEVEAFKEAAKPIVSAGLPPVAEGVPPLPVEVRAPTTKAGGAKVEAKVTATEEAPAAEATAAASVQAANAETSETGDASSAGDKVEAGGGKEAPVTPAAASGNGTSSEQQKEGSVSAGGKEIKTSDKRWKFRVDIRRRNSALNRMDLINAVVGSVGEGHSVSMSSPEVRKLAKSCSPRTHFAHHLSYVPHPLCLPPDILVPPPSVFSHHAQIPRCCVYR